MNQRYEGTIIRNARTTAAGSILIEFDETNVNNAVVANWDNTLFGGNSGLVRCDQSKPAGIIKHVYDEVSDEDLIEEIKNNYPDTESELFKKNDVFIGTIKITFKDDAALEEAKTNRFKVFQQRYIVEDYRSKPRVIICRRCQRFGHISRLCRDKSQKCGKCSSTHHESKNCDVSDQNYKCAHCEGKHITGSRDCLVFKEKEEELLSRLHDT